MKKALFFAGLAAASLLLVGCNKEADVKDLDGFPLEIILSDAQTRTTNAGMSTKWAEGDALSVFYAPAGETTYSANKKFTIQDPETNRATGTVDLEAASNDWYLLYAYASQITSPENTSSGYSYIGCKSNESQKQTGYDSKAHLAGCSSAAGFPLYGIKKNVPRGETPVVEMKHVASAVAIKVKNDAGKAIKITRVEFTAPESIVGAFYVNFAQDPVVLTKHTSYTSATAALDVQDASDLAAGETATFYMGIKPFTAKVGDKLSLKITADAGVVEKEIDLKANAEFKAGFIKTLNIDYKASAPVQTITVSDIASSIASGNGFSGNLEGATVTFVSGKYAFIQDETAGIVLYKDGHGLNAGDKLSGAVSGSGEVYNGLTEIKVFNVETVTSGQPIPAAKEMTLSELNAAYDANVSVLVKLKGVTVSAGFTSRNTTMTDGEVTMTLRDQKSGLTITAGQYDIIGFPSYFNDKQFGVWAQDDIISAGTVNLFGVASKAIEVPATATSAQIQVTGNVAWTVAKGDNVESVSPESGTGEGTITVTFPANTDTENTKTYIVKVSTAATVAGEDEIDVTITQAKAASAAPKTYPYSETFAEGQGDFTIFDESLGEGLTYVWKHETHNDDKYMKATAYAGGGNKAAVSWLISPVVNMTGATHPALSFKHAVNYFTNIDKAKEEATVWVREKDGEWVKLEGVNYPTSQGWTFVESGSIDLSAYVNKQIQIGFKYTSTTTKAGTWEVMNFDLSEASTTSPVDPTLTVTPASVNVEAGKTVKLNVTTTSDGEQSFESSNTGVATVATDGTVTGVAAGSATITVKVAATTSYNEKTVEVPVTVTAADPGLHQIVVSDFAAANFSVGEYVITTDKGTNTTSSPSYNTKDSDLRLYAGNTITVKNRAANVKKIVFNLSAQGMKRLAPITASVGTVTAQAANDTRVEWTGDAAEVTFTVGANADYGSDGSSKAGQLDFSSISVDPWTGVAPAKALVSIAIKDQKLNYNLNDAFDKGTVTATFDDASEADVTGDAVFSGYNLAVAGDYTVKVQYTYSGVTKETSYDIKVVDPSVTQYFTKVTKTPASWVGTYLIVCEASNVAMTGSKTVNTEIKKPTDVAISDSKIVANESTQAITITIEENATSGYLLKTASGYYFYHTSDSSNGFTVNQNASTAEDHEVTLAIDEDGNAVITAHGATLRYNTGSSIFNFYKPTSVAGQTPVQLYKL